MDAGRFAAEVDLLRSAYPDLEVREVGAERWARIPEYPVPAGWTHSLVEVVFQFPGQAGQAPYAFYVRPRLRLAGGGSPQHYTETAETLWGADFAKFSWSPDGAWIPKTDLRAGANMLNFARSFAERFKDLS